MRPERARAAARGSSPLAEAIGASAAAHDADGSFPAEAFAVLRRQGLVAAPPIAPAEIAALLRLLAEVGRGDLSVARIFEGHVNARLLVDQFGTAAQRRRFAGPEADALLGVWNTDAPGDPLRLVGGELVGRKNFASGVDGLDHAIVTVDGDGEAPARRMILVPLAGLPVDRSWWTPMGMRASGSHVVDFSGLRVEEDWHLGQPGDYLREPWFSAGAIRFLAAQVGGTHALLDIAAEHLGQAGRAANPHQAHRLARMGMAVETGYLWLARAGADWARAARTPDSEPARRLLAAANGARLAVETAALAVLEDAERAIGAQGMLAPHPFERRMRDLRVYLRQPNPDGAAAAFGAAIAAGDWAPGQGAGE
ncbi:acyl-CoA dehydrogenase family protein [Amaricoccus solimangrovi]|uniref:Acyl-CoA dehydrogenase n=1 Tax=Amaricoccus solimangrovi TaxID=2589815 RepID=A0A501WBS9_9RHOB|nr:acyl-CoA dehydrogenase family protein [Amaricoccus solimangrovi]TPE46858.1 acyl-CoA dehydrogenase [Amaricoccus solimangrovi]